MFILDPFSFNVLLSMPSFSCFFFLVETSLVFHSVHILVVGVNNRNINLLKLFGSEKAPMHETRIPEARGSELTILRCDAGPGFPIY